MASTITLGLPLQGPPLQPTPIVLFTFLLSTVLLLLYYRSLSASPIRPKSPPSPPKLPIIGHLHQLGSAPHHSLRTLSQKYGPLMLLQLGQIPTLVASSAEMAEEVLKVQDLAFASRPHSRAAAALTPGGRGIVFAPYGEHWRQAKKICVVHLLSSHRVQAFRPAREEEVARLVGKVSELSSSGAAVDMSRALSSFTNSMICRVALGRSTMDEGTTREVTELVARSFAVLGGSRVDNFFPSLSWLGRFTGRDAELAALARRWRAVLDRAVEEATCRRDGGAEEVGFLDFLLALQTDAVAREFSPSTEDIQALLLGMISAGTDTSYLTLQGALEELVKNPTAMKRVQDEVRGAVRGKPMVAEDDLSGMGYLKAAIKETLRLRPPVPLLLPRESMRAAQVGGYAVPTKTRVVVNAWAIARDPDHWESPEEFRPERFLNSSTDFRGNCFQFIPFGSGRRICPGIHFATATVELALANLLYHFNWRLPDGVSAENFDMGEAPGLSPSKRRSLLLMVESNHTMM